MNTFIKDMQEEALKEFGKKFAVTDSATQGDKILHDLHRLFVNELTSHLIHATAKEIERRVDKVEPATGNAAQFNFEPEWYVGYNQALQDVSDMLKSEFGTNRQKETLS